MRHLLPVLALLAGLGSSICFGQVGNNTDPFRIYLKRLRTGQPQRSLSRFANDCGVDLLSSRHHLGQSPDQRWKEVQNFSHALDDQETDFYKTAEVWSDRGAVLVENWDLDLELGLQSRNLVCLKDGKIFKMERTDWEYFEGEDSIGKIPPHWLGYQQQWIRKSAKSYSVERLNYVDQQEQIVPKPKDENQVPKANEVWPSVLSWKDLKLPDSFLR